MNIRLNKYSRTGLCQCGDEATDYRVHDNVTHFVVFAYCIYCINIRDDELDRISHDDVMTIRVLES
jgi:hypothetical protein